MGRARARPVAEALSGGGPLADGAVAWMRIALCGAPGILVAMAGNGWMRGVQSTRAPVVVVLAGNGASAVACPVLVHGLGSWSGLGLEGSAWANASVPGTGWTLLCPSDDAFKGVNLTALYGDTARLQDIVALHLSDELFDLVLRIVHEYGVTNAKSNAVRAFGQLVASLARAHPNKTIKKFFAHCSEQIVEELKHGASSVRTTSSHAAVPSDTTLHWSTCSHKDLRITLTTST